MEALAGALGNGGIMTRRSKANVLIVTNDEGKRAALLESLRCLGQNLVLADSGDEALGCVLRDEFAVILLDARLPRINGIDIARLIRESARSRHTPIVFLTENSNDLASLYRDHEMGLVDHVLEPFVPEVLKSRILAFIDLYAKKVWLINEIAERKTTEERLRESQKTLRALAVHLQSVREEEQIRIAREIHDELGQALTGLKMDVVWLKSRLADDQKPLLRKTALMSALIDSTLHSVRRLASGLRPEVLDEVGLAAAIAWQAREFQARAGIRCKVDTLPGGSERLDPQRSTAAFRIYQEVLTNVARHANATRVDVSLRREANGLTLEVQDNGKGIQETEIQSSKSLGLVGMRERVLPFAGSIEITGSPAKGTKVVVTIPLPTTEVMRPRYSSGTTGHGVIADVAGPLS